MTLARAVAGAILFAVVAVAAADQRAPELDRLFQELSGATNPVQAATVEQRIWRLWLQSGDSGVDAILERGMDAMSSGDLDEAVRRFTRVIEQAPDFAEGWNKRATAYYLNRDLVESVSDIERTLALEPRHFGALSGLGLIFLARGDLVGALNAFEGVLAIHPQSPSAVRNVRQLRERLQGRGA